MAPTEAASDRWRTAAPRYAGLAATSTMAVLSWWVGALPWQHPSQLSPGAPLLPGPTWHGVGLALWLAAAAVLVTAWVLLGRGVRGGGVSRRALLVTAALWAAPLLLAVPLASHDVYSYACQGQAYVVGADPYRVGPATLPCRWLTATAPLWRGQPTPYGPVAVLISAVAEADHGPMLLSVASLRLSAVVGLVLLAVCLPRLAARCGTDPATALWLGLANPVVLIHLVGGAHHDAVMAGLVVAALTLAAGGFRVRAGATTGLLAGLVAGLAAAVKATAVVAVPFMTILAAADGPAGRSAAGGTAPGGSAAGGSAAGGSAVTRRGWLRAVATVGLSAVAAFAAISLAADLDLGWMGALPVSHQPVSWLSPPSAVGAVLGAVLAWSLPPLGIHATIGGAVEAARAVALYALMPLALVAIWWRAARIGTARSAVLGAGAALVATVALGPVAYPWYATTPTAVIAAAAGDRTRRITVIVIAALTFVILPDSRNLAILTRWPGMIAEVVALIALGVWLARRGGRDARDGGGGDARDGGRDDARDGGGDDSRRTAGQRDAAATASNPSISSAGSGRARWKP